MTDDTKHDDQPPDDVTAWRDFIGKDVNGDLIHTGIRYRLKPSIAAKTFDRQNNRHREHVRDDAREPFVKAKDMPRRELLPPSSGPCPRLHLGAAAYLVYRGQWFHIDAAGFWMRDGAETYLRGEWLAQR